MEAHYPHVHIIFQCYVVTLPMAYDRMARFSLATLGRFFVPTIVSEHRVLYLDVDTLANGDVALYSLLPFDSGICYYAALCYNLRDGFLQNYLTQRHFDNDFYYNAGVLYFNVDALRRTNFTESVLREYTTQHAADYSFLDQDVLNRLYGRTRVRLFPDFRYHCQPNDMVDPACIVRHNHRPPGLDLVKRQFTETFGMPVHIEQL
jgi:lipopolysaccharide biosynthesis glycosyltransferase